MTTIIEFPPDGNWPLCDVRLRPATADEIRADLLHIRYRHIAQTCARGCGNGVRSHGVHDG